MKHFILSCVLILVIVAVVVLDLKSEEFRRMFGSPVDHDDFSQREMNHNRIIDDNNLYEAGYVRENQFSFPNDRLTKKFSKLPFSCWELKNPTKHPRYGEMKNTKKFPI